MAILQVVLDVQVDTVKPSCSSLKMMPSTCAGTVPSFILPQSAILSLWCALIHSIADLMRASGCDVATRLDAEHEKPFKVRFEAIVYYNTQTVAIA